MQSSHKRVARHGRNDGQALVLFALFSAILILFVGLGIDLGFAYVTKAQLSKAMDAATLAAVSNYSGADGGKAANLIAQNTFWANYATNGISGRATGGVKVTPHGTFSTDANGNLTYSNTVSAQINTFLIGLLPQWKTLTVGDTAVATRAPVVMTLVVDRTGSMTPGVTPRPCINDNTQGGLYLPDAVTQFINIFDETLDRAALVSFSVSSSNDVPMSAKGGPFKTPIINTLNRFNTDNLWQGGTCSISGLTNALRIQNATVVPQNYVKVVVFFTDGRANMTTAVFATNPKGGIPLNFGGRDPSTDNCPGVPDPDAQFWRTNTSETAQNTVCSIAVCGSTWNCPTLGGTNIIPTSTFTNAHGVSVSFCGSHITEDATNRCVLISDQLRTVSNYVYAVGLTAPNALAPATLVTLQEMANDPDSPQFDPTQPVGAAFLSDGNDLAEVFQQVAADIILRLVH